MRTAQLIALVVTMGCIACSDRPHTSSDRPSSEESSSEKFSSDRPSSEEAIALGLQTMVDGKRGPMLAIPSGAPVPLLPILAEAVGSSYTVSLHSGPRRVLLHGHDWTADVRAHLRADGAIQVELFSEERVEATRTFSDPMIVVLLKERLARLPVRHGKRELEILASELKRLPTVEWSSKRKAAEPAWSLRAVLATAISDPIPGAKVVGGGVERQITGAEILAGRAIFRFNGLTAKVKLLASDGTVIWRVRDVEQILVGE